VEEHRWIAFGEENKGILGNILGLIPSFMRTFAPRRPGNVRRGARRELLDGSEERSDEGWHFTDKWDDGIIEEE
jgi:guanyl-specific ribonuclease Sa